MTYYVGDMAICRVAFDDDIIFDVDFWDSRYRNTATAVFEVIGIYKDLFIILAYPGVEDAFPITEETTKQNGIHTKHVGKWGFLIGEKAFGGKQNNDGCFCCCCKQYFMYASANQEDGRFACWSCKTDERYKVIHKIR